MIFRLPPPRADRTFAGMTFPYRHPGNRRRRLSGISVFHRDSRFRGNDREKGGNNGERVGMIIEKYKNMPKYNHKEIEKKWRSIWNKWSRANTGKDIRRSSASVQRESATLADKPKYYVLDMFPYPSGAGLHVGHPKGYIATDVVARAKMMQGYNVLHPMGWDAFGLPAENYALKNKIHPRLATEENIKKFKSQLEKIGFTYDWSREINTTDPQYYKWTQWVFLKMLEKGLADESYKPSNWCPSCKTGLANEDLEGGKCERCGSEIERKPMRQWVLKITEYADRLLEDLDKLPEWEESIKEMQRNWIGRSEGALVRFKVKSKKLEEELKVFTTRPDTLFGCTYVVVAPEHHLIERLKDKIKNYEEVKKYIEQAKKKSDLERTDLAKEKTGVKLEGVVAINPVIAKMLSQSQTDTDTASQSQKYAEGTQTSAEQTQNDAEQTQKGVEKDILRGSALSQRSSATSAEVPIFVADYVLAHYGTGAIMAVPAHDERDFEFAQKYGLPIKQVVVPPEKDKLKTQNDNTKYKDNIECFTGEGVNVNSGFLDGLPTKEAKEKMIAWLEEQGVGQRAVNYKLQDWVFSRQRYWGEPIPVVHCSKCGVIPVPEEELPVTLPEVESYEPTGTGESPLANIPEWVNTTCPKCGGPAKRETNTMPQWAGSSWYYLRYIDPHNDKALVDKEKEKYWSPVDLYVGGAEHATRHLIYARFWHKFLYDIGVVNYEEPFKRLQHVGLILAEDGRKMSKRWGNVINPDDVVEEFGADTLRVYEMFMGPFDQSIAWSTKGLKGARRFLEKVWNLFQNKKLVDCQGDCQEVAPSLVPLLHKTIKKVTEDIENLHFNTAIAQMMIFANTASRIASQSQKNAEQTQTDAEGKVQRSSATLLEVMEKFLLLLAPFAPHLAEEIWREILGHKKSIFLEKWPKYDPDLIKEEEIELVIQINGKVRDKIKVPADISEEEAQKLALESEKIKKWLAGQKPRRIIFVPGKLFNIVV